MSDKHYENLPEKGKVAITKETQEKLRPVIRELTEKFNKMGFNKDEFAPAIKRGLDNAKNDV
jgi:hypothetical protein